MIFGLFTLLVAFVLSAVAAYYSILGLTAIFSAAVIPVIIMGVALELGKVNATVWLHRNWSRAKIQYKLYLVPAVIFLMLLTSMGIFGFLSKAHSDQSLVSSNSMAQLALIDEKIKVQRENIETARRALTQLDAQVNERLSRGTTEQGVERAAVLRRQQQAERTKLLKDVSDAQVIIQKLNDERAPIASEFRKVEAEVGPIKYIAALIYDDNVDQTTLEKAVRWVIILIVLVFDPLAIVLILAGTLQLGWAAEERRLKKAEKLQKIKEEQEQSQKDMAEKCPKCNTVLINATGIGPFCPNKQCDVLDGVKLFEPVKVEEPPTVTNTVDPIVEPVAESTIESTPKKPQPKSKKQTKVEDTQPEVVSVVVEESVIETSVSPPSKEKINDPSINSVPEAVELSKPSLPPVPETKNLSKRLNNLPADNEQSVVSQVKAHFGSTFPDNPEKGELFLRVDNLPSKLFKYNGRKWIEVDKTLTDSYVYNEEYIKFLVDEISAGRYDSEDLSESERQQIAEFLSKQ